MFLISLRDLQWRRRRFLIGVVATGLVFALALLITGIGASFRNEVHRTVDAMGADAWVVPSGVSGPFTASTAFAASTADAVGTAPGVRRATPLAVLRFTVRTPNLKDINVIALEPGGVGSPSPKEGRSFTRAGEAVVDNRLGLGVGETITIGDLRFRIVGKTSGVTFLAGTPTVFVPLADAQRLAFGGQDLATSIATEGVPRQVPPATKVMSNAEVISDLQRPLQQATQTINFLCVLLWIVAAGIIGSIVYLQALERVRDFAVLKATGTTNVALLGGLAFQAVLLSLLSAVAAVVLSAVLSPILAMPAEISRGAYLFLPVVAVLVGVLASLAGLRRAVGVDPALAFGGT